MPEPKLSVIVPLVDERGSTRRCIEGWVRQRARPDLFELLLVGEEDAARPLAPLLRAWDRVLPCTSHEEIQHYTLGVREARGEVLLFTESHALAETDTFTELMPLFDRPDVGAVILDSPYEDRNAIARMEGRMRDVGRRAHPDPGDWRHASLRGFAVRRAAYDAVGGVDERFGRFAEAVLAHALITRGFRVIGSSRARVRHVNCATFRELAAALRGHASGQAAFRDVYEREERDPLLVRIAEWSARARLDPAVSGELLRIAVVAFLGEAGRRPSVRLLAGLTAVAPRLLAAWLFGVRGALLSARAKSAIFATFAKLAALLRFDDERLFPAYRRAWDSYVRDGTLAWLAKHRHALEDPRGQSPPLNVGEMPDGSLAGFHDPEIVDGTPARWSGPVALVRFRLAPGAWCLRLRARLPRGERSALRLFVNGRPVPRGSVTLGPEGAEFDVEPEVLAASGEQRLAFSCAPLIPRSGNPERRLLGILAFSIDAQPRVAVVR